MITCQYCQTSFDETQELVEVVNQEALCPHCAEWTTTNSKALKKKLNNFRGRRVGHNSTPEATNDY